MLRPQYGGNDRRIKNRRVVKIQVMIRTTGNSKPNTEIFVSAGQLWSGANKIQKITEIIVRKDVFLITFEVR